MWAAMSSLCAFGVGVLCHGVPIVIRVIVLRPLGPHSFCCGLMATHVALEPAASQCLHGTGLPHVYKKVCRLKKQRSSLGTPAYLRTGQSHVACAQGHIRRIVSKDAAEVLHDTGDIALVPTPRIKRLHPPSQASQAPRDPAVTVANGVVRMGSKVQTAAGGKGTVTKLLPGGAVEILYDSGLSVATPALDVFRQQPHAGATAPYQPAGAAAEPYLRDSDSVSVGSGPSETSHALGASAPAPGSGIPTMAVANGVVRVGSRVQTAEGGSGVVTGLPRDGTVELMYDGGHAAAVPAPTVSRMPRGPRVTQVANGVVRVGSKVRTREGGDGVVMRLFQGGTVEVHPLCPGPARGCAHVGDGVVRDALEGKGSQSRGRGRGRLGRRLKEVAKAVGGGYRRLQMPLRLAPGVRGTVAGHRPPSRAPGTPPPSNASLVGGFYLQCLVCDAFPGP